MLGDGSISSEITGAQHTHATVQLVAQLPCLCSHFHPPRTLPTGLGLAGLPHAVNLDLVLHACCRTSFAPLLSRIRGGTANGQNIPYEDVWYTLLADHNATYVPQGVNSGGSVGIAGPSHVPATPASDWAMVNFPFYTGGQAHWGVGALGRWEVDD